MTIQTMKRPAHLEPMTPEQFQAHPDVLGWRQADFAERTGNDAGDDHQMAIGLRPPRHRSRRLPMPCDMAAMCDKYPTPIRLLRRASVDPESDQIERRRPVQR